MEMFTKKSKQFYNYSVSIKVSQKFNLLKFSYKMKLFNGFQLNKQILNINFIYSVINFVWIIGPIFNSKVDWVNNLFSK